MQKIEVLELANDIYKRSLFMNRVDARDAASKLAQTGAFSVAQIATMTRLSHTTVYRVAPKSLRAPGGRFDPRTLDAMITMLDEWNRSRRVPVHILQKVVGPNSQAVVSRLTGIAQSTLSRRLHSEQQKTVPVSS